MLPNDLSSYLESTHPVTGNQKQWEGHLADDIASTGGPEPMALLLATPDELYLRSTRGNYRLPRAVVTKLGRGAFYPWFFGAVRIYHAVPGYPRSLQFKPLRIDARELRAQLGAMGYPIG
jgi:hypothetical protein